MYSNGSVHISHICAFGICTNYSSPHPAISHHLSPPPASPLLLSMIARLGWTFPYNVQDTCAPPTHHITKINARCGKLFFKHDCSIWHSAKIETIGTYLPQKRKVSIANKCSYKIHVLLHVYQCRLIFYLLHCGLLNKFPVNFSFSQRANDFEYFISLIGIKIKII